MESKEKVKSVKRWSGLQRVGKRNVKRRSLECQEEVNGMDKIVKSSTAPSYMMNFEKNLLVD